MSSEYSDLSPEAWALVRKINQLAEEHPAHVRLEFITVDGRTIPHAQIISTRQEDHETFEKYVKHVLSQ